ncbi:hypothetical protein DDJ31_05800 [Streptomyces griseoviridis]|nr:hypothetical protein DDJ31_05800 [Streptomyces griseoviridis]
MERVDIGEYESGDLVPELVIECKADVPGNVSWTVSRHSMDDGAVRLLVFIQNYGSQAETVHIRQASWREPGAVDPRHPRVWLPCKNTPSPVVAVGCCR